jgi:hypothetical protein
MTSRLAVSSPANALSATKRFALCAMFHVSFNAALADPANTALRPVDVASTQGLHAILKVGDYTLTTRRTPGRYTLLLRNSAGQTAEFPMPDRPWNVAAAAPAIDGKAVVDLPGIDGGSPEFGPNTIFILGSRSPALLDQFQCEMPALSPDGKLLAFVAWYPPHFAPEPFTSNFVMLYDLTKLAMANRNAPRTDFPMSDLPDRRVGLQVYPVSRRPVGRPNATASTALPMHEVYDLAWSPDSKKLLFTDEADPSPSNDADQSTKMAAPANRQRSNENATDTQHFLVLIEMHDGAFTVRRTKLQACPVASKKSCEFDVHAAIFGADEVVVTQHIKGSTNKDLRVPFAYSSFHLVR